MIKSQSNIVKFEEFYGYFAYFIRELEEGAVGKRIRKALKVRVMLGEGGKR